MADFLLEIGVEEIPDWMIRPALDHLRTSFEQQLGSLNGTIELLEGTPRRLALAATNLLRRLPDAEQVIAGPYLSAGPKAAEGFARKNGTTVEALQRDTDAKGERYVFASLRKGPTAEQLLAQIIPGLITGIPWPKAMYWTGKDGVRFVRPIRWIVALYDGEILPVSVAGVTASNTTRGHRILGSKTPLPVTFSSYESTLRENGVLLRATERQTRIESALGSDVERDSALLSTLVYLTEFPTPVRGSFDPSYLELPKEILTTVMRHHQRYFSVVDPRGALAPAFIAITNTDADVDGLIRQGNERVLRARFNDARFFWKVDQARPLTSRVDDLAKVTFQAKLGSYKDKADRVVVLAGELGDTVGADVNVVRTAALLCKCDLTTDMVKEFTELQGIVGGLYARAQGQPEAVALAIYDHYKPVSMDDAIPRTLEGQIVAIADKLDTLRECFRIGLIPSGSKDPFALRRAAQGIVKILFEAKLPLQLTPLAAGIAPLHDFLLERTQYYLREVCGFAYDEVNAALAAPLSTLHDLELRCRAIHSVRPTADFEPLAASFKRIKNIVRQAGVDGGAIDSSRIEPGPEQSLFSAFETVRETVRRSSSFDEKLATIATLRTHVDLFFDKILVNDPDPAKRQNRLALLSALLSEFSTVADFSEIVTQGA